MDTVNLKTFLTVVDSQGFSSAAKKLYISQSTVSQHIRALENELGCDLFNHSQRKFQITEEGRLFYQRAKEMLGLYLTTLGEFSSSPCSNEPMRVSVAMSVELAGLVSPCQWRGFCRENPVAMLAFVPCESTREALGCVQTHAADVALTFESINVINCDLEFGPIWTVEEWCVVPKGHELTDREAVELRDLEGRQVAFLHPKGAILYEEQLRSKFARAKMNVSVLEYKDLRKIGLEQLSNPPVLLMPSLYVGREYSDRVSLPLKWENGARLGMATSKKRSAATGLLVEHFQHVVANGSCSLLQ